MSQTVKALLCAVLASHIAFEYPVRAQETLADCSGSSDVECNGDCLDCEKDCECLSCPLCKEDCECGSLPACEKDCETKAAGCPACVTDCECSGPCPSCDEDCECATGPATTLAEDVFEPNSGSNTEVQPSTATDDEVPQPSTGTATDDQVPQPNTGTDTVEENGNGQPNNELEGVASDVPVVDNIEGDGGEEPVVENGGDAQVEDNGSEQQFVDEGIECNELICLSDPSGNACIYNPLCSNCNCPEVQCNEVVCLSDPTGNACRYNAACRQCNCPEMEDCNELVCLTDPTGFACRSNAMCSKCNCPGGQ